ncbi:MAG TPA: tetratricopeptide repeat protein [Bacteroidota bacterium]|nr:tetratricopeptide repeat protein [Bacteroidota bacterium]
MLNPKKKLVKKELKQDTLLTTYVKTSGFYYENKKYVNYALTGLVILAGVIVIFINNRRSNNEKAGVELSRVMTVIDAAPADPAALRGAIDGQPEQGILGLKAIVENYGGTDAGELAQYYLAGAYYRLGDWANALEHYSSFSAGDRLLDAGARAGAAASHEAMKQYADAAELYEEAVKIQPDGVTAPEYLNSAARCYGAAGKPEEAVRLLKILKEAYPKSTHARDAERAITRYSL